MRQAQHKKVGDFNLTNSTAVKPSATKALG